MTVLCGWASIDEHGNASGGKAGDQTGREVKTGNWYNFGQTAVYRWKDRNKAKKYASIIKYWCNDADVGYDQNQRTTLGSWCKAHDWSYKVNKAVETDCSRMVADGVNCTLGKEVFGISTTFYTGNLGDKLMATGLFTKLTASKYVNDDDYLMVGDIINNPARHVITALANGSKVSTSSSTKKSVATIAQEVIDGKWGDGDVRVKKLKAAGYKPTEVQKKVNELLKKKKTAKKAYTGSFPVLPKKSDGYYLAKGDKGSEVKKLQKFLNWFFGYNKLVVDGSFGEATRMAVIEFQKVLGIKQDGFFGTDSLRHARAYKK